jgi:hypothetical protein
MAVAEKWFVPEPFAANLDGGAKLGLDKGAVGPLGFAACGSELRDDRVGGQKAGYLLPACGGAVAAPAVVAGIVTDAGADGIKDDVAGDREQVGFLLDQDRAVAAWKIWPQRPCRRLKRCA